MTSRPGKRILAAEARLYDALRKVNGNDLTEQERGLLDSLGGIEGVKTAAGTLGKKAGTEMNQDAEIAAAVEALEQADIFALDLETIGTTKEKDSALDPKTNLIEGVSVAVGLHKNQGWWFPFRSKRTGVKLYSQVQVFRALDPILKNPKKTLVGSNPKFDLQCLQMQGVLVENRLIDTVVSDWLMDENQRSHGLKEIVEREFGIKAMKWAEAKAMEEDPATADAFAEYALNDSRYALRVWRDVHDPKLGKDPRLLKLFHEVEMEIIQTFVESELDGVCIDRPYLLSLRETLNKEAAEAAEKACAALGRKIDISSSQEVSVTLFGSPTQEALVTANVKDSVKFRFTDKGLFESPPGMIPIPLDKKGKPILPGKNGYYSTDDGILSTIKGNPFIDALLDHRWATKLLSTYVEPYLEKSEATGRIYPDFHQAGTVAGRFCVSDKTRLETSMGTFCISDLDLAKEHKVSIITHRGRPRRILGVYFLGREEMFRVTLDNGSWIEGTRGHRIETPSGWRHIYELQIESRVFSPGDPSRQGRGARAAQCLTRGCIQAAVGGRGGLGGRVAPEIQDPQACLVHVEGSVRREVQGSVDNSTTKPAITIHEGEQEGGASTRQDSSERAPSTSFGHWLRTPGNVQRIEDERIFCSEEYLFSRTGEDRRSSKNYAKDGHRYSSSIRRALARTFGCVEAISRKAERIFRCTVHGFCKTFSTSLVHPITCEQLPASAGGGSSSEKSRLLEHEQGGVAAILDSSRRGYSPYPSAFHREVHGGLCLPRGEGGGGSGWGIPQDGRGDTAAGREEGSDDDRSWMEGATLHDEASRDEPGGSPFLYPTAIVVGIESVGEQDIWDIQVEEDHSFIANGFVNHNTCKNPALQTIPTEKGKYSIKKMFIPAPRYAFVCGDFNQLQFRLVGHFAKRVLGKSVVADSYLAGMDLHTKTQKELKLADRKPAKTINFGFIFGRSADSFAYGNHLPIAAAKTFYNGFHGSYPEIKAMQKYCMRQLCEKGYVASLTGRRRRFPEHTGKDPDKLPKGDGLWWDSWIAWNAMIQGAEADVVRITMRNIYREIKERRKTDPRWNNVRMKVQVHDELVYEAPQEIAEDVVKMVKEKAESCLKLEIPLIFEVGLSSENWEAAKK